MKYALSELVPIFKKNPNYYAAGEKRVIMVQPSYIRADELNLVGSRVEILKIEDSWGGEPFARVAIEHPKTTPIWIPFSCLS